MDELVSMAEHCTRLPVHPRHPYAGELVYTAFSGSHQDAIRKGLAAQVKADGERWEVPYLPIDPGDVGRSYDAVIRVNSQSGKAGAAYLLERDRRLRLPRWVQVEFSRAVQRVADHSEEELSSGQIWELFRSEYLFENCELELVEHRSQPVASGGGEQALQAVVRSDSREHQIQGCGVGPIEAFVEALGSLGLRNLRVRDYSEHAIGSGSDAPAVAYVRLSNGDGSTSIGVSIHRNIVTASLAAVVCAVNRARSPDHPQKSGSRLGSSLGGDARRQGFVLRSLLG
jgi:2-isopropylmalate synthase